MRRGRGKGSAGTGCRDVRRLRTNRLPPRRSGLDVSGGPGGEEGAPLPERGLLPRAAAAAGCFASDPLRGVEIWDEGVFS